MNGRADEARLSKSIQQRVRAAAEQLHYVPNSAARAMVGRRNLTVGVITSNPPPHLRLPIFEDFVVGVVEGATERRHTVKFLPPVVEPRSYDTVGVLRDAQVDGILVHNLDWLARTLTEYRMPVVHVGLGAEPADLAGNQIGAATTDEAGGLRLAARYLLDRGHTDVAMVAGATADGDPLPRLRAFAEEFTSRGIRQPWHLDPGEWTWSPAHGYRATQEALRRWPDVTAIHTGNDWMAVGALHAIRESGRRIPDDIAVIGFGDFPMSAYVDPPLTTVRWPLHDLGRQAVAMLIAQLDGDDATSIELSTELVVRESADTRRRS